MIYLSEPQVTAIFNSPEFAAEYAAASLDSIAGEIGEIGDAVNRELSRVSIH